MRKIPRNAFFWPMLIYLFLGDEFEVSEGSKCKIVSEIVAQSSSWALTLKNNSEKYTPKVAFKNIASALTAPGETFRNETVLLLWNVTIIFSTAYTWK